EPQAGNRIERDGRPPPTSGAGVWDADGALAGDLDDLGGVGEAEAVDGDDLEGAVLDAAVRLVAGAIQDRYAVPRQALAVGQQGGLVGLDREQVSGLVSGEQETGRG